MVYVFVGDGKGKTCAALGTAVRMLLLGKKVEWISWFKEDSWKTAEMDLPKVFKKNLRMHWMGRGFVGGPLDHDTLEGHKRAAVKALLLARDILSKKEGSRGIVDLLVLDEVLGAISCGLLGVEEVAEVIKARGKVHLILTGRDCPKGIMDIVDLVTQMRKVKHPYDKGTMAVSGLDF